MDPVQLAKLKQNVRVGGKGTPRRKKRVVTQKSGGDDKKLQLALKKLQVNAIPDIDELNMFRDDGTVLHFDKPRVQGSLQARTFSVSGNAQSK
eukprot:Awhi_evm1s8666